MYINRNVRRYVCSTCILCMYIHIYVLICCSTNVNGSFKTMHKCVKHFRDIEPLKLASQEVKDQIDAFKPYIPLIQGLRNPGMRNRHWQQVCSHTPFTISHTLFFCHTFICCCTSHASFISSYSIFVQLNISFFLAICYGAIPTSISVV